MVLVHQQQPAMARFVPDPTPSAYVEVPREHYFVLILMAVGVTALAVLFWFLCRALTKSNRRQYATSQTFQMAGKLLPPTQPRQFAMRHLGVGGGGDLQHVQAVAAKPTAPAKATTPPASSPTTGEFRIHDSDFRFFVNVLQCLHAVNNDEVPLKLYIKRYKEAIESNTATGRIRSKKIGNWKGIVKPVALYAQLEPLPSENYFGFLHAVAALVPKLVADSVNRAAVRDRLQKAYSYLHYAIAKRHKNLYDNKEVGGGDGNKLQEGHMAALEQWDNIIDAFRYSSLAVDRTITLPRVERNDYRDVFDKPPMKSSEFFNASKLMRQDG